MLCQVTIYSYLSDLVFSVNVFPLYYSGRSMPIENSHSVKHDKDFSNFLQTDVTQSTN